MGLIAKILFSYIELCCPNKMFHSFVFCFLHYLRTIYLTPGMRFNPLYLEMEIVVHEARTLERA